MVELVLVEERFKTNALCKLLKVKRKHLYDLENLLKDTSGADRDNIEDEVELVREDVESLRHEFSMSLHLGQLTGPRSKL